MKNRNFLESFKNALNGVVYVCKNERNMKVHLLLAVVVLILSFVYNINSIEFAVVCLTIGLVIVCEMFNTAIEVLIDMLVKEYNLKAKIAKDIAAGAVFVSAAVSMIVGYFVFFDKLLGTFEILINIINAGIA